MKLFIITTSLLLLSCDNPLGEFTNISQEFNPAEEVEISTETASGSAPVISGLENSDSYAATASWSWSCDQDCSVRFTIDQEEATTPTGSYSQIFTAGPEGSVEGRYYIHIQARSSSGQESEVQHFYAFFDTIAPTLTGSISTNNAGTYASKTANQTWTSPSDQGSGVSYQELVIGIEDGDSDCDANDLNNTVLAWTRIPSSITPSSGWQITSGDQDGNQSSITIALSSGDYCSAIRAIDGVGNDSSVIYSSPWHTFLPSDISNLDLWYDGADSSTMFTNTTCTAGVSNNLDLVRCWKDKSDLTSGDHATEATDAPLYISIAQNGRSVTRWGSKKLRISAAGTGPIFDIGTGPVTVLSIFTMGDPGGGSLSPIIYNASSQFVFGGYDSPTNFRVSANSVDYTTTQTVDTVNPNTLLLERDSTGSSTLTINFNATATTGTLSGTLADAVNEYTIGGDVATDKFDGDLFELMLYSGEITSTEKESLKIYFANKWGVTY